ncbi:hypothetical protein AAHA92_15344 [Salvia divinorum]|uniref:Uncharacterized protein n=1 Tax=Salvia divinorum TaxID=28513 RepID=A0ABD1HEK1_SALDI
MSGARVAIVASGRRCSSIASAIATVRSHLTPKPTLWPPSCPHASIPLPTASSATLVGVASIRGQHRRRRSPIFLAVRLESELSSPLVRVCPFPNSYEPSSLSEEVLGNKRAFCYHVEEDNKFC